MDFASTYYDLNLGILMPLWVWIPALILLVILCYRWGFGKAKKTQTRRFLSKYFGNYLADPGNWQQRKEDAVKLLGSGYMVIEQYSKNDNKTPLVMWTILNTQGGSRMQAVPVPGYSPQKNDEVQLVRWICEEFERDEPALMYFIRPLKKDEPQA
jgi:hypothetical protein